MNLFDQFIDLLRYCKSPDFNQRQFAVMSKNYSDLYKRAEHEDRKDGSGERIGNLTEYINDMYQESP